MKKGNRLDRIVTKTGDKGETRLADGTRLAKHHPRMEVLGTLEELNAWLGFCRDLLPPYLQKEMEPYMVTLQKDLFYIGGELAFPSGKAPKTFPAERVDQLTRWCDVLNKELPPLKDFVIPGGHLVISSFHILRSLARRTERRLIALTEKERVNPAILSYLNRLSDLIFIMNRYLSKKLQVSETIMIFE